ncbi:hypothetical protein NSA28_14820 [Clostridium perfringens]|uniref:hypothetical protein n=1 Tax=Clostridium perfringens TaxID=1502 RepID=UPI0018DA0B13|nr:hypothetical protein [Clostridium perfringens]MCR1964876.1 hypothetical protein [Clostridium perfringens]QPR50228.1 hypothetical protein I6G88_08960 [Clostridium perfringens]
MKLLKSFLKKCFSSFWMWIGILLTITGILGKYFDIFKSIPYQNEVLIFLIIICMFVTCYKLYRNIGIEYPDALIDYDKSLRFEDCRELFELKKFSPKLCRKYKVDIKEDKDSFKVEGYYDDSVELNYFHKLSIENFRNKNIEISKPSIELLSVNDYENKFFLDRLRVKLKKVTFGNKRYNNAIFGGIFDGKNESKFPYKIDKKESGEIHIYMEIELSSLNQEHFNELIEWIRNIKLSVKFSITDSSSKAVDYAYIIRFNYKKNLIKSKIEEKIKCDKELEESFKEMSETTRKIKNYRKEFINI